MTSVLRWRHSPSSRRPRPRGVWFATGIGVVLVLVVAVGGYLPLVGFLGGATASTAGLVPFPVVRVAAVTLLGTVVVLALLLLAGTRRHTTTATIAVVAAVLVALATTAYPVVTVAVASADRAGDVWPVVTDLWQRFTG